MGYNCDSVSHFLIGEKKGVRLQYVGMSLCSSISMFAPRSAAGYRLPTLSSRVAAVTSEVNRDIVNLRCFRG